MKHPVTSKKSKDSAGVFWYLTCRYCPWSARVGDKTGVAEEKRSHARTCYHYLKKMGLR